MALPYGYTLLSGPPTGPPPAGYSYAPSTSGQWYQIPTPGVDNSVLGGAVSGQQNAAAAQENAFGLGNMFDNIVQGIPVIGPASGALGGAANAASGLYNAGKATVSFLSFVSDLPRLGTTLLGLILIIAGIFALTKGPVVGIVGDVAKEALVS